MSSQPFVNDLKTANMILPPLNTQRFSGGSKVSEQLTVYDKSSVTSNLLLPRSIYVNKGSSSINLNLDRKLTYDLYDNKGNILQYAPENGAPVSIIWGYNKTQPVAKIENATYAQIEALSGFGTGFSVAESLSAAQESTLRNSLPNTMVTTYTYIPLVGVSTITDPKGDTATYTYDSFGRLQSVKDSKGFILSENQYNYKH